MICEYKNKECNFWEDGCDAMHPSQCPHNSTADIKAITDFQRRQTNDIY